MPKHPHKNNQTGQFVLTRDVATGRFLRSNGYKILDKALKKIQERKKE